jgi:thymidine phosphorylase
MPPEFMYDAAAPGRKSFVPVYSKMLPSRAGLAHRIGWQSDQKQPGRHLSDTRVDIAQNEKPPLTLRARRIGIDTLRESIVYMRADCHVCRAEGFRSQARIEVRADGRRIIATLNVVTSGLLHRNEIGLSDAAWQLLSVPEGTEVTLAHSLPVDSMSDVRAKLYGNRLERPALQRIVRDIADARYSELEISLFIGACAGDRLDLEETIALTQAMVDAGTRIRWQAAQVMDKHCVGGLPGNRTTLVVVPIVAAYGLIMPKTSSRAITSPSGTADTMETLAPVTLDLQQMRRVVEMEGACIAWGGAIQLSPADDILIGVERALDLDSEGQLIASVLSKKAAAGATDVILDIPVGPTAKVRSAEAAQLLAQRLIIAGRAVGLNVRTLLSDGTQPVGRGIGPALEARDVLAVLKCEPDAPADLRERSLRIAGAVIECASGVQAGGGASAAAAILDDGRAWQKFQAICAAQGGMRQPPRAEHHHTVLASRSGTVVRFDNRRLARVAKLAGAPERAAAGVTRDAYLGTEVACGDPLYTIHAEAPGELAYALQYAGAMPDIVMVQ